LLWTDEVHIYGLVFSKKNILKNMCALFIGMDGVLRIEGESNSSHWRGDYFIVTA
jgi:hypothetical protein